MKLKFILYSLILLNISFYGCSSRSRSLNNLDSSSSKLNLTNDKLDIYILMGQSNMSGRGVLTIENQAVSDNSLLVLNKDSVWEVAHNPLHFDKPDMVGVGPGMSFGLAMLNVSKKHKIGLVPTAVGGTSINLWKPGAEDQVTHKNPYDAAEKRILIAMKYGKIKGIIWHQGESDSQPDSAKKYLPKLITLIKRVRELVEDPRLPFVIGELGQFNDNYINMNIELNKLPYLVPYTAIVSSKGLTDKGDHIHFNSTSADILGKRYAEKISNLINK